MCRYDSKNLFFRYSGKIASLVEGENTFRFVIGKFKHWAFLSGKIHAGFKRILSVPWSNAARLPVQELDTASLDFEDASLSTVVQFQISRLQLSFDQHCTSLVQSLLAAFRESVPGYDADVADILLP